METGMKRQSRRAVLARLSGHIAFALIACTMGRTSMRQREPDKRKITRLFYSHSVELSAALDQAAWYDQRRPRLLSRL
jgi:hypothetical protein